MLMLQPVGVGTVADNTHSIPFTDISVLLSRSSFSLPLKFMLVVISFFFIFSFPEDDVDVMKKRVLMMFYFCNIWYRKWWFRRGEVFDDEIGLTTLFSSSSDSPFLFLFTSLSLSLIFIPFGLISWLLLMSFVIPHLQRVLHFDYSHSNQVCDFEVEEHGEEKGWCHLSSLFPFSVPSYKQFCQTELRRDKAQQPFLQLSHFHSFFSCFRSLFALFCGCFFEGKWGTHTHTHDTQTKQQMNNRNRKKDWNWTRETT